MLVGIAGFARAGKDTSADALVAHRGFTKMSFADPMREALLRLDPLIRVGEGNVTNLSQVLSHMTWDELKAVSPDIRPLLQRLGTEVGRNMFGENFWVELALAKAEEHEHVVFADVRFINEAEAIKANGGVVIRINRSGFGPANNHVSETEMTDYAYDFYVNNSGDIKTLSDITLTAIDLVANKVN